MTSAHTSSNASSRRLILSRRDVGSVGSAGPLCRTVRAAEQLFYLINPRHEGGEMTDIGVIEQEQQRKEWWAARELPDPVTVAGEEKATEALTGQRFRSPKRAVLNAYFNDNPDARPPWWH